MKNEMAHKSGVDIFNRRVGLLITPELCTGCRACQSSCKEWNKLPAEQTVNTGSYENPPDLSAVTYNRIRFVEVQKEGMDWLFVSQRCMHCGDAGCIQICPAPGALYRTSIGSVGFNAGKCIGCKLCQAACPFDVPRFNAHDRVAKCDLCEDRITNGLAPACAKTCPTGAIRFGERDGLIATAKAEGYGTVYGETDLAGMGVMFAFAKSPDYYGYNGSPGVPGSVVFWKQILRPLTVLGVGAAVAGTALHYMSVGPRDEGQDDKPEGGER